MRLAIGKDANPLPRIATFICSTFGHNWTDPRSVGNDLYGVSCRVCRYRLVGHWHQIDRIGAWRHYRHF